MSPTPVVALVNASNVRLSHASHPCFPQHPLHKARARRGCVHHYALRTPATHMVRMCAPLTQLSHIHTTIHHHPHNPGHCDPNARPSLHWSGSVPRTGGLHKPHSHTFSVIQFSRRGRGARVRSSPLRHALYAQDKARMRAPLRHKRTSLNPQGPSLHWTVPKA